MSFAMTTTQLLAGTKDVTRRCGWWNLKGGDVLRAVKKGQGLKKGEKVEVLGTIEVINASREPLHRMLREYEYGWSEVKREGFPSMTPGAFVRMFCEHNDCTVLIDVMRIQFRFTPAAAGK